MCGTRIAAPLIASLNLTWKNGAARDCRQAVVVGGSVVFNSPLLFKSIQQILHDLGNSSRVFGKAFASDLVRFSTLGNNAGVSGAAALVALNQDKNNILFLMEAWKEVILRKINNRAYLI